MYIGGVYREMVWFQCEDCGENLKKPKLPNPFRICSATKQSVQDHNQCITEAENNGPKGQGKAPNVKNVKTNNDAKQKPDVDVNVGLSERPPWFCSHCNTSATSKQNLLLHTEGKKHRAKARAFHAVNKQPEQAESTPNAKATPQSNQKDELTGNMGIDQQKDENPPIVTPLHNSSEVGNRNSLSSKKQKLEASKNGTKDMAGGEMPGELGKGKVIQVESAEEEETKCQIKKVKHSVTEEEDANKKIKWKKLIKSALKSNPENVLKMKKLRKLVLNDPRESGFKEDKSELTYVQHMLAQKALKAAENHQFGWNLESTQGKQNP